MRTKYNHEEWLFKLNELKNAYSSSQESNTIKHHKKSEGFEAAANYHERNNKKYSFCHKKDHTEDECYKKHPELRPNSKKETKAKLPETNTN